MSLPGSAEVAGLLLEGVSGGEHPTFYRETTAGSDALAPDDVAARLAGHR